MTRRTLIAAAAGLALSAAVTGCGQPAGPRAESAGATKPTTSTTTPLRVYKAQYLSDIAPYDSELGPFAAQALASGMSLSVGQCSTMIQAASRLAAQLRSQQWPIYAAAAVRTLGRDVTREELVLAAGLTMANANAYSNDRDRANGADADVRSLLGLPPATTGTSG